MSSDVRTVVIELVGHYSALIGRLAPRKAPSSTGYVGGKPGSRPPLNVEVSDELASITGLADHNAQQLRDALRFQHEYAATIVQLRAVPALVEALPNDDPLALLVFDRLDEARRHARVVLELDPRPVRLELICPACSGVRIPLVPRQTLLANAEAGEVWCSNKRCGYVCERTGCWCADPTEPRQHRYRWGRSDLLRLVAMTEQARQDAEKREAERDDQAEPQAEAS